MYRAKKDGTVLTTFDDTECVNADGDVQEPCCWAGSTLGIIKPEALERLGLVNKKFEGYAEDAQYRQIIRRSPVQKSGKNRQRNQQLATLLWVQNNYGRHNYAWVHFCPSLLLSAGLFEEVMRHAPSVPALVGEQLGTCQVEDLPSVEPHAGVLLPIRLDQVRPDLFLVCEHLAQPVLDARVSSSY